MGRKSLGLTAVQQDDELFAKVCVQINKARPYKLASYGLVSYTTIYQYLRRQPVSKECEPAIRESLRLYNEENDKANQASKESMEAVLL